MIIKDIRLLLVSLSLSLSLSPPFVAYGLNEEILYHHFLLPMIYFLAIVELSLSSVISWASVNCLLNSSLTNFQLILEVSSYNINFC